jgi:hypothetical protein
MPPPASPSVWGVVVIHGVGATAPGDTLQAFVPSYLQEYKKQTGPVLDDNVPFEMRLLPQPDSAFPPAPTGPTAPNAAPRKVPKDCFPMHIRRVDLPAGSAADRVMFAEVYWADLSAAGKGLWQLMIRVFTVIFGVSYLADQAATFVGLLSSKWLRVCLYVASSVLCGPVAALNVFFLGLLVAYYVVGEVVDALSEMNRYRDFTATGTGVAIGLVAFTGLVWWLTRQGLQGRITWVLPGIAVAAGLGWGASEAVARLFTWVEWAGPESLADPNTLTRLTRVFFGLDVVLLGIGAVSWKLSRRYNKSHTWLLAFTVLMAGALGLLANHWITLGPHGTGAFLVGLGLCVAGLCVAGLGVTFWALARWKRESTTRQALWSDVATAGAGLMLYFGTFALVWGIPCASPALLPDVGMIGYGLAGGLLSLSLWRWGVRYQWSGSWVLLHFFGAVAGFAFAAFAIYRLHTGPMHYEFSPLGREILDHVPTANRADALETHLSALIFAIRCCLTLLAGAVTLAAIAWLAGRLESAARKFDRAGPALDAAFGSTLLQIGGWIVLAPALCLIALDRVAPEHLQAEAPLFLPVWKTLALHIDFAALVGVLVVVVFGHRLWWVGRNPPDLQSPVAAYSVDVARTMPRFLFSRTILYPLIALSVIGAISFGFSFAASGSGIPQPLDDWLARQGQSTTIVAVFVGVLGVVYALFQDGLRAALHIVTDIVSHFYRLRQMNPFEDPARSAETDDFTTQNRIQGRVCRVVQEVLWEPDLTHLTIVAHSQGTVYAIQTLLDPQIQQQLAKLANLKIYLVTMGSPFSHLYQFYFPRRYTPLFVTDGHGSEGFNPDWNQRPANLLSWVNIYRVDDYIGTEIRGNANNTFPENKPIRARGHTYYWSDEYALPLMWPCLPK